MLKWLARLGLAKKGFDWYRGRKTRTGNTRRAKF